MASYGYGTRLPDHEHIWLQSVSPGIRHSKDYKWEFPVIREMRKPVA
jgi:hypothetical protein